MGFNSGFKGLSFWTGKEIDTDLSKVYCTSSFRVRQFKTD